ncbi:exodeoxyribonuclease VII large subunit [Weissella uvarum]|uniref:exodeoxyribonuclease VII large subunit n=1 Tax=Weissella uvarum TaxID=1479233 RepID=UPI00196103EF|nr:exodeoxyribonuclease VII large subunit [Weissella uvarum]MBM7616478.1 exodeoxyribonuclease VII large subunit [Weissella uvarum]MCM0595061.1 exodeoxyribonuclease VII large subunit [Weissella uvarum]
MAEYLTVTTLTKYLKRKFTADPYLKKVYVTGEISNFRPRRGHQYFSLKDESAVINATMFKGVFDKLPFQLEAGMKVNVVGHIDLYAPNGSYSIIVEKMEPDGIGALYQAYEQLKQKLQQAGWFDQLQRNIPRFPKKIAVITSPSGAVIRDILTTVQRRYPIAEVDLYPAVVQGENAVPSLIKQLQAVAQRDDIDVLIIGRGGGSIEDLWAFNDETLAKTMLQMPMPIISSVGHETDTTIADFIADKRAATPTAAAELATPFMLTDVWQGLQQLEQRLVAQMQRQIKQVDERYQRVANSYVLTQPERLYEGYLQRVDLAQKSSTQSLAYLLKQRRQQLTTADARLLPAMQHILETKQQRFSKAAAGLQLVSPLSILGRGYSLVEKDGQVLTDTAQIEVDDPVEIRLAKGTARATITEIGENND